MELEQQGKFKAENGFTMSPEGYQLIMSKNIVYFAKSVLKTVLRWYSSLYYEWYHLLLQQYVMNAKMTLS